MLEKLKLKNEWMNKGIKENVINANRMEPLIFIFRWVAEDMSSQQ